MLPEVVGRSAGFTATLRNLVTAAAALLLASQFLPWARLDFMESEIVLTPWIREWNGDLPSTSYLCDDRCAFRSPEEGPGLLWAVGPLTLLATVATGIVGWRLARSLRTPVVPLVVTAATAWAVAQAFWLLEIDLSHASRPDWMWGHYLSWVAGAILTGVLVVVLGRPAGIDPPSRQNVACALAAASSALLVASFAVAWADDPATWIIPELYLLGQVYPSDPMSASWPLDLRPFSWRDADSVLLALAAPAVLVALSLVSWSTRRLRQGRPAGAAILLGGIAAGGVGLGGWALGLRRLDWQPVPEVTGGFYLAAIGLLFAAAAAAVLARPDTSEPAPSSA